MFYVPHRNECDEENWSYVLLGVFQLSAKRPCEWTFGNFNGISSEPSYLLHGLKLNIIRCMLLLSSTINSKHFHIQMTILRLHTAKQLNLWYQHIVRIASMFKLLLFISIVFLYSKINRFDIGEIVTRSYSD